MPGSRSLARLRAAVGPAELAKLVHEDRLLVKQVAARFGADRRAVTDLMREYGIPPRVHKHVSIDPHVLRDLWRRGCTRAEMAARFDASLDGVDAALKRYGLTGRRPVGKKWNDRRHRKRTPNRKETP